MSCEAEAVALLRKSGHKLTPQRLMVVTALRHVDGHLSAGQILEQIQRSYPYVDVSTVYRTVAMLKELRLVTETDMGGGELIYEWVGEEPHHHLICRHCGAVQQLDHEEMLRLSHRLLTDYGFQADIHHFAIFGACRDCAGKAETTAAPGARGS